MVVRLPSPPEVAPPLGGVMGRVLGVLGVMGRVLGCVLGGSVVGCCVVDGGLGGWVAGRGWVVSAVV